MHLAASGKEMLRSLIVLVLLSFSATSCELFGSDEEETSFERNKIKWEQAQITDYSYDVMVVCFCLVSEQLPARIEVRSDTIFSALRIRDNESVDPDQLRFIPTVSELFDVVEEALSDADSLVVEYDQQLGFPKDVAIDYIEMVADDEIWYTITNLTF